MQNVMERTLFIIALKHGADTFFAVSGHGADTLFSLPRSQGEDIYRKKNAVAAIFFTEIADGH